MFGYLILMLVGTWLVCWLIGRSVTDYSINLTFLVLIELLVFLCHLPRCAHNSLKSTVLYSISNEKHKLPFF